MGSQKTGGAPDLDVLGGNAKPLRYLIEGEYSFFTQALETTLESLFIREASNHPPTERFATAGNKAPCVQYASDWPRKNVGPANGRSRKPRPVALRWPEAGAATPASLWRLPGSECGSRV